MISSAAMLERPSCTILCVDDNAAALEVRAGVLAHHGFDVVALQEERDALAYLADHAVHCVVLDYLMPEIRGDKLATMIRERYPALPIVLISGAVDDPEDIGGADLFVSKSAGHRRLLEALDELSPRWASNARSAEELTDTDERVA